MQPNGSDVFVAHCRQTDGAIQSVREHLEGTSSLASLFAAKVGLSSLGTLAGLLHDLGKYSDAFQAYLKTVTTEPQRAARLRGTVDHSSAGAQHCWRTLLQHEQPLLRLAGQMVALCLASHHTGLIDCLAPDGDDVFSKRMKRPVEPTRHGEEEETIRERGAELLNSPLIADEIGRSLQSVKEHDRPKLIRAFMLGLLTRFLFSALVDADRLDTANFQNEATARERYHGEYPGWDLLIRRLRRYLIRLNRGHTVGKLLRTRRPGGTVGRQKSSGAKRRHRVDSIRSVVSSACRDSASREKGLYQLTVPTGGGKTLASLRFALHHAQKWGMDRIIYVAPYTSIIDQNARVARTALGKHRGKPIVLEHHSNLVPERDTLLNRLLSENWDAPVIFTTAVQFLETLFGGGTRGVRRMHQLANAVIILDEVQTLPIKTIHLVNNALNFLVDQCGSTVVLCTATQPLLDKVDPRKGAIRLSAQAQMVRDVAGLFMALHRVDILDRRKVGGWTEEEIANLAIEEVRSAGSTLVVVNMKVQARNLYERCKQLMDLEQVYHLSTGMCPAHRMETLQRIRARLERGEPVLCISTQLIEAGVDIDFGSVIRYLAGLDSIAQAAGRCNRHGLRQVGKVLVVNPAGEDLSKLADIRKGRDKAERVLDEFRDDPATFDGDLQSPKAMSRYYTYYFFERAAEMAYPVTLREHGVDTDLLSLLSDNGQSVAAYQRVNRSNPPFVLHQSFATAANVFEAIETPGHGVIVPYGEDGRQTIAGLFSSEGLQRRAELLKQAQRYSVNVFPRELDRLRDERAVREVWEGTGVYCLSEQYYSDEFGISSRPVSEMQGLVG